MATPVAWQPTLYRELDRAIEDRHDAVEVEEVAAGDADFRDTYLAGYEVPEDERQAAAQSMEARWRSEDARRFLARSNGNPVAAATLVVFGDVARLANCATRPEHRGSGAQTALIRARLEWARLAHLGLAVSDARQGGASLRNLSRAGFAIGAQITQWRKQ